MATRRDRRSERGAALAVVGMAMVLLVGMAAVGVDVGHIALTANEAQVVADASATAGALALKAGAAVEPAALGVAGQNTMDGDPAQPADMDIVVGTFDWETREFSPGGENPNAVSATAERTVQNVFAGIFGDQTSHVVRDAVAAMGPATMAEVDLPMALSDCHFPPECEDESCLPTLTQVPNGEDNGAFTGFFEGANGDLVNAFLHPDCEGEGADFPSVSVGDHISLNNGELSSVIDNIECMVCDLGITEYTVPIITHCDENFVAASSPGTGGSGDGLVYGFATITIDSFNYANGGVGCGLNSAPQSINLHSVIRTDYEATGAGGPCTGCPVDGIAMVQ